MGGHVVREGRGVLVMGDPVNALVWLANALGAHGLGVEAGQFVLAGTMTGLHAARPGEAAVADFGDLGAAEVVFA